MSHVVAPRRRIAVDMTPLEPNGLNGGAGLVATTLVRHLAALAPEFDLTLLTAPPSHAELAPLDAANVRRECVMSGPGFHSAARRLANRLLPDPARVRLKRAYWSLRTSRKYDRAANQVRPDVLLCPFTVPYFWQAGVPCVSIVYDLQHLSYPEFFTPEQGLNRQRHIVEACAKSARVVCISKHVRTTLLASLEVCPQRVVTIPLGLLHAVHPRDRSVIDRLGLQPGEFLLYPANFWPHKNHARLFEALRAYRLGHPYAQLKLVCTGAPNAFMRGLETLAASMLPAGSVVFAGYLPEAALAGLFEACAALVYPSLYEGFGMPVLEAMAHGKPVLCSNVTSLPEVAGDAAVYFDPNDPRQIASAVEALDDTVRMAEMVSRGRQRASACGDGRQMAEHYLALVRQVLQASPP